jgi:hypothetical protein
VLERVKYQQNQAFRTNGGIKIADYVFLTYWRLMQPAVMSFY